MAEYLLRLFILVPIVGGMAWGSLVLWRKVQIGLPASNSKNRPATVVDILPMGTNGKIAVIDFRGRELLVAVSRSNICLLAQAEMGDFDA